MFICYKYYVIFLIIFIIIIIGSDEGRMEIHCVIIGSIENSNLQNVNTSLKDSIGTNNISYYIWYKLGILIVVGIIIYLLWYLFYNVLSDILG